MVVGAYMISNKAEEAKMNRERALTGESASPPSASLLSPPSTHARRASLSR
jgi:hypothetical protein